MSVNYYVYVADLNSLYEDKVGSPVIHSKVSNEDDAKSLVSELQTSDQDAWYRNYDCEDSFAKWDSENPCLSVIYKEY